MIFFQLHRLDARALSGEERAAGLRLATALAASGYEYSSGSAETLMDPHVADFASVDLAAHYEEEEEAPSSSRTLTGTAAGHSSISAAILGLPDLSNFGSPPQQQQRTSSTGRATRQRRTKGGRHGGAGNKRVPKRETELATEPQQAPPESQPVHVHSPLRQAAQPEERDGRGHVTKEDALETSSPPHHSAAGPSRNRSKIVSAVVAGAGAASDSSELTLRSESALWPSSGKVAVSASVEIGGWGARSVSAFFPRQSSKGGNLPPAISVDARCAGHLHIHSKWRDWLAGPAQELRMQTAKGEVEEGARTMALLLPPRYTRLAQIELRARRYDGCGCEIPAVVRLLSDRGEELGRLNPPPPPPHTYEEGGAGEDDAEDDDDDDDVAVSGSGDAGWSAREGNRGDGEGPLMISLCKGLGAVVWFPLNRTARPSIAILHTTPAVGAGAGAAGGEVMFTRRTFGAFGATLASDDRFIAELERLWCTLEQPTRDAAVRRKVNKYFSL